MFINIILKQDIKNLGEKDDVTKVKAGYARNFLIPKGMAIMATDSNKKILAENLRQAAYKQDKIRKEADATAEALEGKVITIGTKAGTTGRIFGAVTAVQVAEALAANGFTVDRRRITFDNDIKDLGEHTANLNLHKEVKIKVALNVVSE